MPVFELTLLGTFGLTAQGTPRAIRSHKAQALLAYLGLRPLHAHRRDTLASLLWSHVSTSQAKHSLRQTISCIRGCLDDVPTPLFLTESDTIRLNAASVSVDALRFTELSSSTSAADLREATAAYVGELLEGFHLDEPVFDRWLASERERLQHRAVGVLSRQLQRCIDEGAGDEAIAGALRLLALDPLLEWVHRALMRLYQEQGRLGSALAQYNQCSRIIQHELGVELEVETRQLCQELLLRRAREGPPTGMWPQQETAADHDRTITSSRRPPKAQVAPKGTVIVLHASPVTRAMLERLLVPAAYAVVAGRTVADGLRLLTRLPKAVVLIADDSSRHSSEVVRAIRASREDVPMIVVTAEPPMSPHPPAQRLRYVRRPVEADALLRALADLLGEQAQAPLNG